MTTHLTDMTFDIICGNPPYNTQSDPSHKKTQPIWHKFVNKSFELVKDDGYVCLVHPSGWRNVDGIFKKTQLLITSKKIVYLEMHNKRQGKLTFGVETPYDWYVIYNKPNDNSDTSVMFQDGEVIKYNLKDLPFIPSGEVEEFKKLIAVNNIVDIINNRSDYGTDKKHMDKTTVLCDRDYHTQQTHISHSKSSYEIRKPHMSPKTDQLYIYPCVYTVRINDIPTLKYSSINTNGHFGVPKVIWGNGRRSSMGIITDKEGKYGLTQFAYAIVDDPENLEDISKALKSQKFIELMKYCDVTNSPINHKVISLFRKDFWKDFV